MTVHSHPCPFTHQNVNFGGHENMSTLAEQAQTDSLRALVKKLLEEHRDFSSQVQRLDQSIIENSQIATLTEIFVPL